MEYTINTWPDTQRCIECKHSVLVRSSPKDYLDSCAYICKLDKHPEDCISRYEEEEESHAMKETKRGIDIYTYADIIDQSITIIYIPNRIPQFIAYFESSETKQSDRILVGTYGEGTTAIDALQDYISKIQGKILVVDAASSEHRKEFDVPLNLALEVEKLK